MSENKNRISVITSIMIAVFCFVVAGVFRPLYRDVDNFTISTVLNGLYGDEYYCIHLHPALCFLVHVISVLIPISDAFLLLAHILVFFETVWLLYLIISSKKPLAIKMVYSALVLYSVFVVNLYNVNYTIQSASFVFTGWISLFLHAKENRKIGMIIGILFVSFGTMWRVQSALLFVPFIALELLASISENKSEFQKNGIKRYGICIAIILVILASQIAINNSPKYSNAIKYDRARVSMQDYPTLSWSDVKDKLSGIDESEYTAVKIWVLADTDNLTLDTIGRMAAAAATTKHPFTVFGLSEAFKEAAAFIVDNSKTVWISVLLVFLFLIVIIISRLSLTRKAESTLAVLGGTIIILYFTMVGRAPLRVWYSVIYAILLILIRQLDIAQATKKNHGIYSAFIIAITGILLLGTIYSVPHYGIDSPNLALFVRANSPIKDAYNDSTKNNDIYIWENWHKSVTFYYMQEETLPSKEFLDHNICAGDWVYGQNYFLEHLNRIGIPNPFKSLLNSDHIYYVADNCDFTILYLRKHYDQNITATQTDTLNGIPIWSFSY